MNMDDFMRALTARFPNAPLKAWSPDYRRELEHLSEAVRRAAFDATMTTWTEAYAPKPAHFMEAVREAAPDPRSADSLANEMPWEKRDKRMAALAKELNNRLWREIYTPWRAEADRDGWAHLLLIHLSQMSGDVARTMIDHDCDEAEALAHVNRRRLPPRLSWLDDADVAAMRLRGPQQRRVMAAVNAKPMRRPQDRQYSLPAPLPAEVVERIRKEAGQ